MSAGVRLRRFPFLAMINYEVRVADTPLGIVKRADRRGDGWEVYQRDGEQNGVPISAFRCYQRTRHDAVAWLVARAGEQEG